MKVLKFLLFIIFFFSFNCYSQSAMMKYWIKVNPWTPETDNGVLYPNSPNSYYETYKLDYRNLINNGAEGYFREGEIADKENNLYNKFVEIEGYIIPPTTGQYIFYVAGSPDVTFHLSSDENVSNITKRAYTSQATGYQQWGVSLSQTSAQINLTSGNKYYFKLRYNCPQGGFNTNQSFSAAWSGPGFARRVIVGKDMQPYLPFTNSLAPSRNLTTFSGNVGTWINVWITPRESWWQSDNSWG
jgi:PA14 domain